MGILEWWNYIWSNIFFFNLLIFKASRDRKMQKRPKSLTIPDLYNFTLRLSEALGPKEPQGDWGHWNIKGWWIYYSFYGLAYSDSAMLSNDSFACGASLLCIAQAMNPCYCVWSRHGMHTCRLRAHHACWVSWSQIRKLESISSSGYSDENLFTWEFDKLIWSKFPEVRS